MCFQENFVPFNFYVHIGVCVFEYMSGCNVKYISYSGSQ